MKILLKALILGCFLLIVTPSFSQAEKINQDPNRITLVDALYGNTILISYHLENPKNLILSIYDIKNNLVKTIELPSVSDYSKKHNLNYLESGTYQLMFKDSENQIVFQKTITKK